MRLRTAVELDSSRDPILVAAATAAAAAAAPGGVS